MNKENKLERIVLVGPVYPYKGGISHYTGLMYRALNKKYDVTMVSYQFQYPKLLYKKEQRDYSNDSFKIEDTNYWIHTANPFNWLRTAKKIKALKPELVIIQWWHPYFAPCYFGLCKLLKGIKILFVCHNVFPHERFAADILLTKLVLKQGSYHIVQSGTDADDLMKIVPDARFEKAVHPTYHAFKISDLSRNEARKLLEINENKHVLLFFGFVREYKGLKYLLKALTIIKKDLKDVLLLIVGDFGDDKKYYLKMINDFEIQHQIQIYDGYIPDKEVERYFMAADLVILPYESATQSGIVQIAFGFEKPVVVTDVGGLPDVVENEKTGYVVEAQNPDAIANAVIRYFNENRKEQFLLNIQEQKDRFSWDRMVEIIERLTCDI